MPNQHAAALRPDNKSGTSNAPIRTPTDNERHTPKWEWLRELLPYMEYSCTNWIVPQNPEKGLMKSQRRKAIINKLYEVKMAVSCL
jgi:hypothetical protein